MCVSVLVHTHERRSSLSSEAGARIELGSFARAVCVLLTDPSHLPQHLCLIIGFALLKKKT